MVKAHIYALYDEKANKVMTPLIVSANDVQPIREVTQLANDPQSMVAGYPHDFLLIRIGEIDLETGQVTGYETPVQIIIASEVVKKPAEIKLEP